RVTPISGHGSLSQHPPENIFDKMRSPPAFNTFQTFDPYAKELTKSIANTLKCDYFLGDISRFILDLNKKNAYSFSKWSRQHFSEQDKHDLLEKYNEGLIVLSACIGGEVGDALRRTSPGRCPQGMPSRRTCALELRRIT
ncbi:MAG: hypothetical protein WCN98_11655, partial [Verrucomicrobiaceae bacterium]